ncbi:MAG: hypothetical protein WCS54_02180 [Fibrobacteraceae bacterium]|jgi:hypothetical protein
MWAKLIAFRDKIRGLERWQKIALLCIAIAIPAGIFITTLLISRTGTKRKSQDL